MSDLRKPKVFASILLFIVFLIVFNTVAMGYVKKMYRTNEPLEIYTRLGTNTILFFNMEVETYVLTGDGFQVLNDEKRDKLIIVPQRAGAWTNLNVVCKGNIRYVFRLIESESGEFYDMVDLYPTPDINYKDIINLLNKRSSYVDPALKELVQLYEVDSRCYRDESNVRVEVKRAATIENLNKTVYWFRVHNLKQNGQVHIPFNVLNINGREVYAVIWENRKDYLEAQDFTDLYVIVENTYIEQKIRLMLVIDQKNVEFYIPNIPYSKIEFKIFVVNEGEYKSVIMDDYER